MIPNPTEFLRSNHKSSLSTARDSSPKETGAGLTKFHNDILVIHLNNKVNIHTLHIVPWSHQT